MMAETAPNKTLPGPGIRTTVVPQKTPPTHRVKKLLETYHMTADRSMLGPSATATAADLNYAKYYQGYQFHPRGPAYKLPPDVELSKTTSPDDDVKSSKVVDDVSVGGDLKRLSRRESSSGDRLKSESPHLVNASDEYKSQNGLVTLSRVDGRQRHGSSQSDGHRAKSCDSSHSGSSGRHLTGEMIRQLQEQRKGVTLSSSTSSLAAQSPLTTPANVTQQYLMQVNAAAAAYEKALKEKSYLRQDSNHRPTPSGPPAPPATATATTHAFKAPVAASSGPMFLSRDRSQSDLEETRLAGRDISCFVVGGERRLCLPQILNIVLDHITLQAINAACDDLQIFCSTCTPEQLEKLKLAKIIPVTASQCGLITKSDAERLCSVLLDRSPPLASMSGFHAKSSPFSFRVHHTCFGTCHGIVLPEAYTTPAARCIECLECQGLFCPQKFVCHSHGNRENRTCHWGFDSANWRSYLLLSDDYTQTEKDKLSKVFNDFKARYTAAKRKQSEPVQQHPPTNGGSTSRDLLAKLEDQVKLDPDGISQNKKPRLSDPPPPPPHGPMFPSDPAYGLYLYQSWAHAAAKLGSGTPGAGPLHPAAAAAWQAHLAQAVKEGKNPLALPFPGPGSPSSRLAKPVLPPPGSLPVPVPGVVPVPHPRLIKTSPVSESDSPTQAQDSSSSHGDAFSPPATATNNPRRSSSSSTTSTRPSLAEDIHSIRISLEGASSVAKEKILKILERLTTRLAAAESERDSALSQLKHLQRRFDQLEDELHKKRAELREALRQDVVQDKGSDPVPVRTNGGPKNHRTAVTLELLQDPADLRHHEEDLDDDGNSDEFITSASSFIRKTHRQMASTKPMASSATASASTFSSVGLPKVDMKSPARIIEEKERIGLNRSSSLENPTPHRFRSRSPSPSNSSVQNPSDVADRGDFPDRPEFGDRVATPSSGSDSQRTLLQRRRSGTPASIKSRESEDLRERMLTMEAELRALREELISRPTKSSKPRMSNDDSEASSGTNKADASAADETSASKRARLSQTSDDDNARSSNTDTDVKADADRESSTSGTEAAEKSSKQLL